MRDGGDDQVDEQEQQRKQQRSGKAARSSITDGFSCYQQIAGLTGRKALHTLSPMTEKAA